MLNGRQHSYDGSRIQPLEVCPQLVGRKLFLVCNIQVEVAGDGVGDGLDVVHMLRQRQ